MFDLLTNILIWIIAIPIFVILFRAIPKEWFRLFGLVIFTALVAIIFANFRFVEEPIPKTVVEFLTFPFTLVGILLLLLFFNYWLRLKNLSVKSGEKVDNKGAAEKIGIVRKEILIVLLIFAIATNNATSELFTCYLEQQGDNAIEQSYRRPVRDLTPQELLDFRRGVYDIIVVLAENPPYEPRLQEAIKLWNAADSQQKPYILLSGGKRTSYPATKGYPCLTPPEAPPNRTKDNVRNEIASRADIPNIGLRYDPRYEGYFTNLSSPSDGIPQVDLTEADQMCSALTSFPNISAVRSFVIIEPSGVTVRSSGDEISKLIKSLEKNKLLKEDARNSRRILLITSPIEATRAFLSFRNQELNASLTTASYPSDSHSNLSQQCPWPIGKQFKIKPQYFLFNAEAFVKSERAWTEIKELVFYTLRFWLRPPLTDERPYYPKQTT
ncbi:MULTISPECIES: hypothetical protein [Pseudanabaena]|uniref:DUF218 domain-containing protein n=2 Tax=Pseudanabaena TaxID=1152 RepID=L8MY16_9CYAN|nr:MULTISPECIES: hypothetical protein [Pseudanabaena]ELS32897.1 hypothetical protein Pse7429DRAFT_1808 [Pseudanabaena biceps PCC 7429]MDG3494867.1 hypothetical protein [Pseudanabaena catenata USMAC16]